MREFWVATGLLWLAGVGLRLSILAVPPVILSIQVDLRLSGTEVGILSGLPMVLFAIAALPGSLSSSRAWARCRRWLSASLIAGVASALRGAILDAFALYAATAVMSAGIAITQPALPPAQFANGCRATVSLGTAIYTNGLLMGETLPVMSPSHSCCRAWTIMALGVGVVWGVPLVFIAILNRCARAGCEGARGRLHRQAPHGLVADWRNPLTWQIGVLLGQR